MVDIDPGAFLSVLKTVVVKETCVPLIVLSIHARLMLKAEIARQGTVFWNPHTVPKTCS